MTVSGHRRWGCSRSAGTSNWSKAPAGPRIARDRMLSHHAYFFTDTWTCRLFS
jgi:hypothetical protein